MSEDNTKCRAGCLCGISASQNSCTSHHSGFSPHWLPPCRPTLAAILCSHVGHANTLCRGAHVCILQLKCAELEVALGSLQHYNSLLQCPREMATQVVRDEGSVLACALNATCAALIDAGVLLHNMFGEQRCD